MLLICAHIAPLQRSVCGFKERKPKGQCGSFPEPEQDNDRKTQMNTFKPQDLVYADGQVGVALFQHKEVGWIVKLNSEPRPRFFPFASMQLVSVIPARAS